MKSMTKTLNISDTLKLPTDIGTETLAILGRRGSGKSNTGTVLIEELIDAGQQVVLLDPKGEGWGLKAQGTAPGKDVVVFGEPEGDLPLREEHGEMIAEWVVTSGRSVVLSLAGFDSDTSIRRFVARFAERLFALKKKPENHGPLMVVIEEAHLFVPQRVDGAQADVVSRLQRLVRQGRSMGLGVTLIDQRAASVNKDVLTQIELLVCHQLTSPHDRKAIDAWIEANAEADQAAEFRRTLPTLQSGETWVWSPAKLKLFERVKVRRRSTFDSGATPILGKGTAKRPAMREVDLDALRGQLERVVEEKKANDPGELKKRIAELEKRDHQLSEIAELANRHGWDGVNNSKILSVFLDQALTDARKKSKVVEKPVMTEAEIARVEKMHVDAANRVMEIVERLEKAAEQLKESQSTAGSLLSRMGQYVTDFKSASVAPPVRRSEQAFYDATLGEPFHKVVIDKHSVERLGRRSGAKFIVGTSSDLPRPKFDARAVIIDEMPGLSKPQQRILDAVAWWNSIGVGQPSRAQVGFVAGIKPTGGHFSNTIGPLSSRGLIQYAGDGVQLTTDGRAAAGVPRKETTLVEYHRMIRKLIKTGASTRLLDAVIRAGGDDISVHDLGHVTGIDPTGGHFSNSIGPLSTLGLIQRNKGVITPTRLLFPEGLT
jgi:uncharacterized protein